MSQLRVPRPPLLCTGFEFRAVSLRFVSLHLFFVYWLRDVPINKFVIALVGHSMPDTVKQHKFRVTCLPVTDGERSFRTEQDKNFMHSEQSIKNISYQGDDISHA